MEKTNHLKFFELLRLSTRTFRTKPTRAILTVLGMSVGIGTVLFLVSLGYGLQYILIGKLITTEDSLITMEISYPTESNILIKPEDVERIRHYEDVAEVSTVAGFPGEITVASSSGLLIDTLIVEPSYFRLSGQIPTIGKYPTSDLFGGIINNYTILPLGLLPKGATSTDGVDLSILLGEEFNINVFLQSNDGVTEQMVSNDKEIPIVGILNDDSQPTAILLDSVLPAKPPFYRKLLVKANSADVIAPLKEKLADEGFFVSAKVDLVNQAKKIAKVITIVLGVFGITALVVSAIGMFNTMIVGFMERVYEVGILKSIGATDGDVRNLFLLEATLMGVLGGAGGVGIGLLGGKSFNILLSVLSQKFGGEAIQLFITPWWFSVLIMGVSIIIGLLSGFWPAQRATKLSPKEAFTRK